MWHMWLRAEYMYACTESALENPVHHLLGGITLRLF